VGEQERTEPAAGGADAGGSEQGATVRLALIAAPGSADELARALAVDLPALLGERVSARVSWSVPVVVEALAAQAGIATTELIDAARERMLRDGCDLAICITDLPLRMGRRPVVADASAMHGVGLLSLPALGALQLHRRARDAVLRLVDGLMGESLELSRHDSVERRRRVGRRLAELAAPERRVVPDDDDDVDIRFVAAVVRGNLRLLGGMLRANRPWRLIVRLSSALAAAVAAVVFSLVTSDIWRVADSLGWPRLLALTVLSLAAIVAILIVAHGLWERALTERAREQVVLFNVATVLTLVLGVVCLYTALLVLALAGAWLALDESILSQALGHRATFGDYAKVAWLASSLATVAGALGAGLESDEAVREAAYGYRPERETERDRLDAARG
jgi:uncharacterized membrane protein